MSAPDRYIPGVPCWADTNQPDPAAAAQFYSKLFGWQCEDVMPPDAESTYLIGRLSGGDVAAITGFPDDGLKKPVWNTYVWVESADATAAKVKDSGGTVLMGPWDVLDQGRMAVCADPEGATFMVWEPRAHRGSAVVNEPGSVNFNDLYTRDPEKAKQFYGAVFGWDVLDLGPGGQMWSLPGYGDHLELLNPGTNAAMAEMGAPAGFQNVVASLTAIAADDADTQPHWGITFGVADADATAAKAVELGGTIILPPTDAPWVRMSVLRDPAGAVFGANQFVPENT
ncbi:VOC family protein [Hoyosella sp. YIM 151337]|uniref:VOC family protein n=1 Tax=Hoyosella sp. YIM 151337 TaxID=2992742 RepID=UPI00223592BC|nr:VOC family protein [Hoyosella sp. YIM 151337]MCW4354035.1 VOC family protein [Hoyosella sp. YIM 151337]